MPNEVPLNEPLGPLPEPDVTALSDYFDAAGQRQSLAYSVDAVRALLAAERERLAKLCVERAQLSWAAADQPYAAEVKMQHESVAAAMEELAGELRA